MRSSPSLSTIQTAPDVLGNGRLVVDHIESGITGREHHGELAVDEDAVPAAVACRLG